jgi:gliding motility-associated-like protein
VGHRYFGFGPYRGWVIAVDTVCSVRDSLPFRIRFAAPLSAVPPVVEVDACAQPPVVRVQGAVIGATQYTWYPFGFSGPTVNGARAQWTVPALGNYTVYLVAADTACGRADTSTTSINVVPLDSNSVKLPNVFSPDNNGTNDCFQLPSAGQVGLVLWHVQVYNRWGECVYAETDPAACWDGTRNGLDLPDGVYFYLAQWSDACGHGGDLHGSVTLVRSR